MSTPSTYWGASLTPQNLKGSVSTTKLQLQRRFAASMAGPDPMSMPIPRTLADQFSIRYHLSIECLKSGHGNSATIQALLEMWIATDLLIRLGHGCLPSRLMRETEKSLAQASERGLQTKLWVVEPAVMPAFCQVALVHDFQLYTTPVRDLMTVMRKVFSELGHQ